jgi:D-3-phosphoglycerate dehydrogenase/microcystin synthetase protein McyI
MYDPAGEAILRAACDVRVLTKPAREEVLAAAADAHALCSRYPHRTDAAVIAAAPDLVIVASSGRGTDAIDLAAATARGVAVVNNPGFGPIPVSEQAIGFMIALGRQFFRLDRNIRAGDGWRERGIGVIAELQGRTLGIVGLGAIGTEMTRKCRAAFDMEVVCYDPHVPASKATALGARMVDSLDALLEASDYVSMHPELNDATRGMIGEAQLRRMKPTAFLINTARGKVVQQAALARALREGWIAGAALDVYEDEPLGRDNPLYACDNIILSPHVGGLSVDALKGMAISAATQIVDALSGRRPAHIVNPEAWEAAAQRQARLGIAPARTG